MISQPNLDQLFEHRVRMPHWLARLGCATLILLPLAAVGLYGWLLLVELDRTAPAHEVALADLNGDGHLDAFVVVSPTGPDPYSNSDLILFGDGNGRFTPSDQALVNVSTFAVSLGDVNNDGSIDAIVGDQIYHNYDNGRFHRGPYLLRYRDSLGSNRWQIRLADLNGDGALDLFGAACCGGAVFSPQSEQLALYSQDTVWLNNNRGGFSNGTKLLDSTGSSAVALGDLNGDGTIDAFVAKGQTDHLDAGSSFNNPNFVWLNDGEGQFTDSGQRLGLAESTAVALGDFDNDGDLDAVVGNNDWDELWLNDGQGNFSLSSQRFNGNDTRAIFTADLNEDGLFDLIIVGQTSSRVWLNEGAASFHAVQRLRQKAADALALGDLNEDGFADLLVAGVESYRVWLGAGDGRFSANSPEAYR